jgi:hypothetical protein
MSKLYIIPIGSNITINKDTEWSSIKLTNNLIFESSNIEDYDDMVTVFERNKKSYYVKNCDIKII